MIKKTFQFILIIFIMMLCSISDIQFETPDQELERLHEASTVVPSLPNALP